jgi:hypothetical protein
MDGCQLSFSTIVGPVIGFVSFAFTVYRYMQERKLKDTLRANNWDMFDGSNNSNGHLQRALEALKKLPINDLPLAIYEDLHKADAFGLLRKKILHYGKSKANFYTTRRFYLRNL